MLEFRRGLVEELVGGFDVELDGDRLSLLGERGEHVDLGGDGCRQLVDRRGEERKVLWTGRHLDGEGIARPHIGGAAPPPTIGLVDELQVDPPRVEAIVGDDEAKASDQHRFATGPVAEAPENLET